MNEVSMRIIADHPWGVGFANFEHVSGPYISAESVNGPSVGSQVLSAHNTFLNVLAETGYVGFALWITALVTAGVRLWRISCRHSGQYFGTVARALFIGLLAIVPAMLTHNEEQSDYLYWAVGLACAIYGMEFRTSVMPVSPGTQLAARGIPSKEAGRA
jgi:O-antigen ligase